MYIGLKKAPKCFMKIKGVGYACNVNEQYLYSVEPDAREC